MAPALKIKLEIVLDNEEQKYFPGDEINGKIHLTPNQNFKLNNNFRLAWTGRIQVQPIPTNKETRVYFDECWKLDKINLISKRVYDTILIPIIHPSQEPNLELQKNKTTTLLFKVHVPNDRPLPSSCTAEPSNRIVYLLEAFIADQSIFTQKVIPVYEFVGDQKMREPQKVEQVFMISNDLFTTTSAMRVTLPCRGSQPGIAIPISISIWNNMEFSRKQGISISLIRINQVIANGRTYSSQGEKIQRIVTDLNLTSDEKKHKVQTVKLNIPIPRGATPSITFESSQLLSINYFIRVQVFAQEGIYTTSEGKKSQFMKIDLPFMIGTTYMSRPSSIISSDEIFSNLRLYNSRENLVSPAVMMKSKQIVVDNNKRQSGIFNFLPYKNNNDNDNDNDEDIDEDFISSFDDQITITNDQDKRKSYVFNIFPDDDDDDSDSEEQQNRIVILQKQELTVDKRVKPNN